MSRLWDIFDGEPYLDNPRLLLFNPKQKTRKVKKMAQRRRRYTKPRKNVYVPLANPKRARRRRYGVASRRRRHAALRSNPVRRRYTKRRMRSNPPDFLGFKFKDVAIAGGAVVVAPFIERQLIGLLPTSMAGTAGGRWAVKVGTAVATGYAAKALLGRDASRLAFIALGANLIADAVAEFAPNLMGSGSLTPQGYYPVRGYTSVGGGPSVFALPAPPSPYTGLTGTAAMAVRPGQDPFTPVF